MESGFSPNRRRWLQSAAFASAAFSAAGLFTNQGLFTTPGLFAEELELMRTPPVGEGPFYPDKMPLDTDNDLLIINDKITPGVGTITHLTGRVLTAAGSPVRNATVEIWQVDGKGVYLHSADQKRAKRDANFQGFGRFLTDSKGGYYFRTVKPVAYPGRTPHIHVAINIRGKRALTTQLFINGEKQNDRDGLYRRINPAARKGVLADFKPVRGSKIGELAANFDIVLGRTPDENQPTRPRRR